MHKSAITLVLCVFGLAASSVARGADETPKLTRLKTAAAVEFGVLGEKPKSPAPTILLIALDLDTTLTNPSYAKIGTTLMSQGYVVVALDAPKHGKERGGADKSSDPLATWRTRMEAGEDIVGDFTAKCRGVFDYMIEQGYTDQKRIAVAGTSRGGFLAVHLAAVDPRVRCVVAFAPVTDLLALSEFHGMADESKVKSLALENIAEKVAGRPMWVCIGNNDERVGTDRAIAFTRSVVHAAVKEKKPPSVELHVMTSVGHSVHPTAHDEAAAWVAARMKD
jgi:dienelactone hydrolase